MTRPFRTPHALWRLFKRRARHLTTGGDWADTQSEEVRHNLRWFWFDGFFAAPGDNIVITYLALYVLALGATSTQIGLMSSLSGLAATLVLLPGALLAERIGRRKQITVIAGGGIARLAILFLVLAPFLIKGPGIVIVAIALSVTRDAFGNLALPAWISLTADMVPLAYRGRYFSTRNFFMGITGMAATLLIGALITRIGQPQGYQVALAIAFALGMASTYSFSSLREPPQAILTTRATSLHPVDVFRPLATNAPFLALSLTAAMWNFSLNIAGPFFNPFMVEILKATPTVVGILSVVSSLAGLPSQRVFGPIVDRLGPRRVQLLTGLLIPIVPLSWLLVRQPWHIIPINLLSGFLWGGYNLASFNMLLALTPQNQRARFSALYQVIVAISLSAGAGLGSLLISRFGYMAVFLGSGIGRLISALAFARFVRDPNSGKDQHSPQDD